MWQPGRTASARPPKAENETPPGFWRDRLAVLLALVSAICLASAFFLSKGTQLLMPGPLASAHGAIEKCSACHTKSGSGKLSWTHGLVAGDPLTDSKACLACHKIPDAVFSAHGASPDVLEASTGRLKKRAARSPQPLSARVQSIVFPTDGVVARDLYCATCHQEHQGINFDLTRISGEQCRSCHVVRFDSFDGAHPKFDNYPFGRRTRIVYDHAGHFRKHYPEVMKKEPAKRIPDTCASCHNSTEDKRIMATAPFDQTCASCHLDQIIGKERASGPKGIAFLALPGLDLETLKTKNAAIGEWPDASEAELTPFMMVMLSRDERGRELIKTVATLNLQDLANASDDQLKAVTELVWEIKGLYYALIKENASDVLGKLDIGGGVKPSATLVADLTASIPRDVVISAQQQWLPNLAAEMTGRRETGDPGQEDWSAKTTEAGSEASEPPEEVSGSEDEEQSAASEAPAESSSAESESSEEPSQSDAPEAAPSESSEAEGSEAVEKTGLDPPPCTVSILGQCLSQVQVDAGDAAQPEGAAATSDAVNVGGGEEAVPAVDLPPALRAGLGDLETTAEPGAAAKTTVAANTEPGDKAADQDDDLLFPTEEELRELKARNRGAGQAAEPEAAGDAGTENAKGGDAADADAATEPQTGAQSVISIESDVDPESWADYGGWYRQDYAIFYRPIGHKDRFIYTWLALTGPRAPKGDASPAAAVFESLTSKDAQGSCTKCHSVDDIRGEGRLVNFSPLKAEAKQGRFTSFIHEPHLTVLDSRGCLTCHALEQGQPEEAPGEADTASAAEPTGSKAGSDAVVASRDAESAGGLYLKSYEHGDPHNFASGFGAVKKDLCQTCHTTNMARQDCLLCHKYHVNGVITPIMNTKLPTE